MPYQRVRYDDRMLAYCKGNAQKTIDIIDSVLSGEISLGRAAHEAGFDAIGFRKGLKALESMADGIPKESPADIAAYKTPEEMFYSDVFCISGDDYDELWDVIPMDSSSVMQWVYEGADGALTEREMNMVRDRYEDGMTLEECAGKYGVTRERVRQILSRSIRKMRNPLRKKILVSGMEMYNEAMSEYRMQKEEILRGIVDEKLRMDVDIRLAEGTLAEPMETLNAYRSVMDMKVDELNLSVRSYNCLARANYKTVGDLAKLPSLDSLFRIRNLGRRSLEEIIDKLKEIGVKCPITEGVYE